MKKTNGVATPIALICINKSRLKVYHKEKSPTYYLERGQEFQIELFNPTSDTVLAKIHLNGNQISQGGLVLRPGERIFLERYIDVAKKFMFDTYEVANTEEVKKAIEDNGDFKVQFYKESKPTYSYYGGSVTTITTYPSTLTGTITNTGGITNYNLPINGVVNTSTAGSYTTTDALFSSTNASYSTGLNLTSTNSKPEPIKKCLSRKIETGRVEAGGSSNQKLENVNKSFDYFPFHTVEYKLLPVSQKINTSEDINVKRYCTNCGAKQKPEYKFCPSCGKKC